MRWQKKLPKNRKLLQTTIEAADEVVEEVTEEDEAVGVITVAVEEHEARDCSVPSLAITDAQHRLDYGHRR